MKTQEGSSTHYSNIVTDNTKYSFS